MRPTLVPQAQIPAAHNLTGVATDSALLLGSAVGGVLIATLGTAGVLWFNAATFVLSAALLAAVPCPAPGPAAPARLRRAARALWLVPDIRRAAVLVTLVMSSGTAASALLAPYVLARCTAERPSRRP